MQDKLNNTDMQVLGVLKYFFRDYCDEKELSTIEMQDTSPVMFSAWVMNSRMPLQDEVRQELTESGICEEAVELIEEIFTESTRAQTVLTRVWPALSLSGRPPVKHQPRELELNLTVRYQDGRYSKISAVMPQEGQPLTDGFAGCLVRAGMMDMLKVFCSEGLDKLHEESLPGIKVTPNPT